MSMRFDFLFLGKTKESYLAAGIDDFASRLRHYTQVEIRYLREKGKRPSEDGLQFKEAEGKLFLEHITRPSLVVALDASGRQVTSENLAELLQRWEEQGHRRLTFLIGGHLGFAPRVHQEADLVLALSKMTFTHEMARLILLEQLYRACSIRAGSGYHK